MQESVAQRILQALFGAAGTHIPLVGGRSRAVLKNAALRTGESLGGALLGQFGEMFYIHAEQTIPGERGNGDGGARGAREGNGRRSAQTLYPPAPSEQPVVSAGLDLDVGGANVQSRGFLQQQPYRIFCRRAPGQPLLRGGSRQASPLLPFHSRQNQIRQHLRPDSVGGFEQLWRKVHTGAKYRVTGKVPNRIQPGDAGSGGPRGEAEIPQAARQKESAVFPTLQLVKHALGVANFNVGMNVFVADVRHSDIAAQPATGRSQWSVAVQRTQAIGKNVAGLL